MKPVRFESVTVRYAQSARNAVDDVTLEVPAGRFTVIVGPSGCGKSTLLRTVNGLVTPSHGSVYVGAQNVDDAPIEALRRNIGYVIQAVGLFSHMTVAKNVGVVPSLLGWDREKTQARVRDMLELVDLDPAVFGSRYPRELSGGQQQRVGVARAIAGEPEVLLMDEPFGAVDSIVRHALQDEMLRIARSLHTTILFVTHDVDEALKLADTIAVMRDGRIEQHAAPLELLGSPATPYVAQLFARTPELRTYDDLRARLNAP